MKNKGTDQNESVEFNRVDSGKSPGEQPLNEDKEVINNQILSTRFFLTLLVLLAVIIIILVIALI